MQKVCIIGAECAFFKSFVTRIICIIGRVYVKFGGRVRCGVSYWSGRVVGRGEVRNEGRANIYIEKYCRKAGRSFAEVVALEGLTVSLSGHVERGGGVAINGEAAAHQINESVHDRAFLNPPSGRVVVTRRGAFVQGVLPLCQRVVDGSPKGESVSFMPL